MRLLLQLALTGCLALPAIAAENAVLRNGFAIRHESRAETGGVTRLFTSETDFVEVATADITGYEPAPERLKPETKAEQPPDIDLIIAQLSRKHGLDAELVRAIIKTESAFDHRAVSPKGARGLMQLMPGTAAELGVEDSFDPEANVEAGVRYLRELLSRHNNDLHQALAAYNAGPGAVERHRGVPPYRETINYVRRIVTDFNRAKAAQPKPRAAAD